MTKEEVPTKKTMKERKGAMERLDFEPYKLKVDWLKESGSTSINDIDEVRDFVSSYEPPTKKYEVPKQRLLGEIDKYQAGLKK
jgi:hypothetical protein